MRLTAINELAHFHRKNFTFASNGASGRELAQRGNGPFQPFKPSEARFSRRLFAQPGENFALPVLRWQ